MRAAFCASPTASAADLVQQAQAASSAKDGEPPRPPIPPPLIRLDPDPRPTRDGILTPFLLQALFLGASALGLLTRRKVQSPENVRQSTEQRVADRERQAAEDRIDELQALDLLVSVCAVPEATGRPVDALQWREDQLRSLTKLLGRVDVTAAPVSRQTVASVLHFVSLEPPPAMVPDSTFRPSPRRLSKYCLSRPALGLWAWRAYESLPSLTPDPLNDPMLGILLSLLYPRNRTEGSRFFFHRDLSSTNDRHVLNGIAERVLVEAHSTSHGLLAALANAAIRARRVDLLDRLFAPHIQLDETLRLKVAVNAIKLLAGNQTGRRDPERASLWTKRLVHAVKQISSLSLRGLRDVEVALRRLQSRIEVDPALLAPLYADIVIALLESSSAREVLSDGCTTVIDALRHLLRAGEPDHARRTFDAIPSEHRTLAHFEALLKLGSIPLTRHVWRALAAHPTLQPTKHLLHLYFAALAAPACPATSSSIRLRLAYRVFTQTRRDLMTSPAADSARLANLWHDFLGVCVVHAPTPQLRILLSRMEHDDGVVPDERTAALLVLREMRREDARTRRASVRAGVVGVGPHGERCPEVRVERSGRRGGGKAQMRRVREQARQWSRKLDAAAAAAGGGEEGGPRGAKRGGPTARTPSPVPTTARAHPALDHLVLQDAIRWSREYPVDKLILLVRARLGLDLASLPAVAPASCPVAAVAATTATAFPTLDPKSWRSEREPLLKLFIAGFHNRGRQDLAERLVLVLQGEAAHVRREELHAKNQRWKEAKKEKKAKGGPPVVT